MKVRQIQCDDKYVLIVYDYSQIELRVGGMYHEDSTFIKTLNDPHGDLHQITSDKFHIARSPNAKEFNFAFQFGGGAYAIAEQLTKAGVWTTPEQAQVYLDNSDKVYPRVRPWRAELVDEHLMNGCVRLLSGRTRKLNNINLHTAFGRRRGEKRLSNNTVQGLAQDIIKAAMIRLDCYNYNIDRELPKYITMPNVHRTRLAGYALKLEKYRAQFKAAELLMLMQVHDELIFKCQATAAKDLLPIIGEVMCWYFPFPFIKPMRIRIAAEGGIGYNWKQAKSKEPIEHALIFGDYDA